MPGPDPALSRRALLGGALLLATGCTVDRGRPNRREEPSDAQAIDDLTLRERQLIATYDELIGSTGGVAATRLSQARADHVAHLAALTGASEPAVTPAGPGSTAPAELLAQLLVQERASATAGQAAALAATDGGRAAVLASIAASHLGHGSLLSATRLAP